MATDRRIDPAVEYFERNRRSYVPTAETPADRNERIRVSRIRCSISARLIVAKMEMLSTQLKGARYGSVELEPYRRAVELDEMRLEEI